LADHEPRSGDLLGGKIRLGPNTPIAQTATALSAPDSKAGRLQRACLKLLGEHKRDGALPTNGRFVFYELEQRGVVPKHYEGKKRQPRQDVTDALTYLRDAGIIPWPWIEDPSRILDLWRFSSSVYKYAVESIGRARIDLWQGEPPPLYLFEARAAWAVSRDLCSEYLVPNAPCGGQCRGFLINEVAPLLAGNERRVRYIGDYELRGPADQIETHTKKVLEQHAGREFTSETWEKIALIEAQVRARPRLRRLEITKYDKRYKPPKSYQAVECEALTQTVLLDIIRKDLDALLPEPLEDVLVREQAQRERVRRALARMARPDR
jgi:hypothetical protein